jgi:hypothetical protein
MFFLELPRSAITSRNLFMAVADEGRLRSTLGFMKRTALVFEMQSELGFKSNRRYMLRLWEKKVNLNSGLNLRLDFTPSTSMERPSGEVKYRENQEIVLQGSSFSCRPSSVDRARVVLKKVEVLESAEDQMSRYILAKQRRRTLDRFVVRRKWAGDHAIK